MFPSELRAFHAVAQSGSIRKAAELLDVAIGPARLHPRIDLGVPKHVTVLDILMPAGRIVLFRQSPYGSG